LGNKIIKAAIVILVSIVSTTLIFILLIYAGLARRILKVLMPIFGLDPREGGSGEKYDLHFMIGIISLIFIIMFILSNRYLFRKKNQFRT
jgi:hypothetical protein